MMDKKTRKIVASVVAVILVVAMVLPLALSRM